MCPSDPTEGSVAEHIKAVRDNIARLEAVYDREPGSVQLLAVSKTKPQTLIREAAATAQIEFGENYVEEGIEKITELKELGLIWHYIGHIQSNKTRPLAAHYDWVQSVDRLKIATRLAEHRPVDSQPLNVCIQLKLDDEETKSGCSIAELDALAAFIDSAENLRLRGIMTIPAPREDIAQQRAVFAELHNVYRQLEAQYPEVDTLSMGMSGDMEAAIAEGSTMVRIGTAVFGKR